MRRVAPLALLMAFACVAAGCGVSESAVGTAIAMTAQAQAFQALAQTMTAAAAATSTPTASATSTSTSTRTSTPAPTATPEPGPGMAYVPDFVGMELSAAEDFLEDNHWRYIWVAQIDRGVPEWLVIEQSPEPDTLFTIREDRIRLVVAVHEFTPTPHPEPRQGAPAPDPCGEITYEGVCIGTVCVWCENNTLYITDCAWCGGTCGWIPTEQYFGCLCPAP